MAENVGSVEEIGTPEAVHNCPSCSHWLPEGTLACPECQTLAYGQHLSVLAQSAQRMETEGKWAEARERWLMALEWLPGETRQATSIQAHVAQIEARLAAEAGQKAKWQKRLGPLAPAALFLMKFKSAVFLLFKLKFLFSILAYFGLYSLLFGWEFALGLTVSVLVHEMGHYVAAKWRGLKVEMPMFLPGFGAYVKWYGQGVSIRDLGLIALAGPLAGLGAALTAYGMFHVTHRGIFLWVAYLGARINLINLFAVPFTFLALDGAQAAYDLSQVQRWLVAGTCFLFFGLTVNLAAGDFTDPRVHWMFAVLGGAMLWRSFTKDAPDRAGSRTFALFQGLVIALGALMLRTELPVR